MYSIFKNNFMLGILSALVVGFLLIMDYRRKNEAVDTGNLFKISGGVFAVVSFVVYLSNYLHAFNKQIGGVSDLDLDTGNPNF